MDNIPSERIESAIDALKWYREQDNCIVNMNEYHDYGDDTCYACLGGIAAFKELGVDPHEARVSHRSALSEYSGVSFDRLTTFEDSLDYFRVGACRFAFNAMGLGVSMGATFDREIIDYHDNPELFIEQLLQLASDLRDKGF